MIVKTVRTEWFQDYKYPSLFIAFPRCTFKCDRDAKSRVCQNSHLPQSPDQYISAESVAELYLNDPITKAIVCGGLDPFDTFDDLYELVSVVRGKYCCNDPIIIYTGYTEQETATQVEQLKKFSNIIIKFGRFVPYQTKHYDKLLGVNLASPNQYAKQIS